MSKILVVGATGNIGTALVCALQKRNADFIVGVRTDTQRSTFQAAGIAAIKFDFQHADSMRVAFSAVDRAFVLLPLAPDMIAYGAAALEAARQAGLGYLVKSSELGADQNSPLAALHAQGSIDAAIKNSGIPYAILKPNFFMQNFAVYYGDAIQKRDVFCLPQADAKISFVDVRDIAEVAATLLMSPDAYLNCELDITGPEALSNHEVVEQISAVLERRVNYSPLSDQAAVDGMRRNGVPEWTIAFMMSLHQHVRDGNMAAISDTVRRITGNSPRKFSAFAHEHRARWKN